MHPDPQPPANVVPLFNRHEDLVGATIPPDEPVIVPATPVPSPGMYGVAPVISAHAVDAASGPYGGSPANLSRPTEVVPDDPYGSSPATSGYRTADPYGAGPTSAYDTSPYGSGPYGSSYQPYPPPIPTLPRWAATVLDEPFVVPEGVEPPAIWSQYQRAVESIPDDGLRASVLRAGWLALRDELGEA